MRLATGPRPWPIRLFAILFAGAALGGFFHDLQQLGAVQDFLADLCPAIATRDGAIVTASARLSVGLIPVALIWLFAARVARWIIAAVAMGKMLVTVGMLDAPGVLAMLSLVASITGAALLFTPRAAQWLASKGKRDGTVLE